MGDESYATIGREQGESYATIGRGQGEGYATAVPVFTGTPGMVNVASMTAACSSTIVFGNNEHPGHTNDRAPTCTVP